MNLAAFLAIWLSGAYAVAAIASWEEERSVLTAFYGCVALVAGLCGLLLSHLSNDVVAWVEAAQ